MRAFATLLLALPASALGGPSGQEAQHIPEPLVFDLVRGLGARQGEVEVNTLAVADPTRLSHVDWAPEIEVAVLDNLAFEFELPMVNASIHAVKLAGQWTFNRPGGRFLHGTQVIAEFMGEREAELTGLYLYAWRPGGRLSLQGMTGARLHLEGDGHQALDILQNTTAFTELTDAVVAGVETNLALGPGGRTSLLVMPQAHGSVGRHFTLQLGLGALVDEVGVAPRGAMRVIMEW